MSMEVTPASGTLVPMVAGQGEIEAAQEVNLDTTTSEEEETAIERRKENLRKEVKELEVDIQTLKDALQRKENHLAELKKELGVTRWSQFREGLSERYSAYQSSEIYNKLSSATATTKQTLGAAGEKTSAAFKSFGSATAKKWNDIRESPKFHSMEEKMWATTGAIKAKFSGQKTTAVEGQSNGETNSSPSQTPSAL